MTARDFCYWLQGYFEIHDAGVEGVKNLCHGLTGERVSAIKRHLAMVFAHDIDPQAGGPEAQAKLSALHHGDKGDATPRC